MPAKAGDTRDEGSIPGLGKSPEVGNRKSLHYSCLDNPMDRGVWWTTVHRVAEELDMTEHLGMRACTHTHTHTHTHTPTHIFQPIGSHDPLKSSPGKLYLYPHSLEGGSCNSKGDFRNTFRRGAADLGHKAGLLGPCPYCVSANMPERRVGNRGSIFFSFNWNKAWR